MSTFNHRRGLRARALSVIRHMKLRHYIQSVSTVCVALSALISSNALAQDRLSFGASVGVVESTLTGEFDFNYGSHVGVQIGGFTSYAVLPYAQVRAEIEVARSGFDSIGEQTDELGNLIGNYAFTTNLYYLSFPILAQLSSPSLGPLSIYGIAGVRPDVIAYRDLGIIRVGEETAKDRTADFFSTFSISSVIGGGVQSEVLSRRLFVEVRRGKGLTDLADGELIDRRRDTWSVALGVIL